MRSTQQIIVNTNTHAHTNKRRATIGEKEKQREFTLQTNLFLLVCFRRRRRCRSRFFSLLFLLLLLLFCQFLLQCDLCVMWPISLTIQTLLVSVTHTRAHSGQRVTSYHRYIFICHADTYCARRLWHNFHFQRRLTSNQTNAQKPTEGGETFKCSWRRRRWW